MSQQLEQRLNLVLTAELRQAIQILQFSTIDLVGFIQEQIIENPVLEMHDFDKWLEFLNSPLPNHRERSTPVIYDEIVDVQSQSLADYLEQQLHYLDLKPDIYSICIYLIGNLDERGYLDLTLQQICNHLSVSLAEASEALHLLQSLEPAGIGASSLEECLMLQLSRKTKQNETANRIVQQYLLELAQGRLSMIAKHLDVEINEVKEAIEIIRTCQPRPGLLYAPHSTQYILPDVTVEKKGDQFQVRSNERDWPQLRISSRYRQLIRTATDQPIEVIQYVKNQIQSGIGLIKGIEQRRNTIERVAEVIVEYQQDFFEHGIAGLKPLTLKKVAERVELHESTVSRATQHKYVQTPRGIFPFRFFFPSGIASDQGMVHTESIKMEIKRLITNESKLRPLSDQKIGQQLQHLGIRISRRTVAKYRDELGIPASSIRREA
ncbi:RNA polymerase, sigma 54 subunit, RpoN/SigL [Seinonella peptonophila]|uniref:RNA polymerase, sigma 54 subunit, RpoN/SigL n=1 Tax=Seinonella peptonophila TaxID=112248 RepID=A0A1M4SMC9_9BACL|nr:RNA polymerase, sigma 54 subunit, RpoN/SigL [Seinonella peptonophila]